MKDILPHSSFISVSEIFFSKKSKVKERTFDLLSREHWINQDGRVFFFVFKKKTVQLMQKTQNYPELKKLHSTYIFFRVISSHVKRKFPSTRVNLASQRRTIK